MLKLTQILADIYHYKYLVIFPLSVVEGPIITIISGFLTSLGKLNFFAVYLVVVFGDIIGDCLLYLLGKYGINSTSKKLQKFLGITKERLDLVENKFSQHPKKIFLLGKASHGVGASALFAAGAVKFPFTKFLFYNLIITFIKSLILLLIGYYFGRAYLHIKTFLDYAALVSGFLFVVLYILFIKYTNSYLKDENINSHR